MRILTAPQRITLSAASPARLTMIVHNDSDDDRVCFPTVEGLDASFDVFFEPALGFIEARCAMKFEVFIERATADLKATRTQHALWTLYADGRVADRSGLEVKLEPHRSLTARVTQRARPELVLSNEGAIDESVHIDTLVDAHATPAMARRWTLGPGSWVSVPLEFEEADAQPVTLCISGGPRPILIDTPVVQHPRAAASDRRRRTAERFRRGVVAAGALAASLLIGLPVNRDANAPRPAVAQGPVLAEAMPFVALEHSIDAVGLGVVRVGAADRLFRERIVAMTQRARETRHVAATAHVQPVRRAATVFAPVQQPTITRLDAPSEVKDGGKIAIRFRARDARGVRIVAKVGPVVVNTVKLASVNGQITMRAPRTYHGARLMTVRIYALGHDRLFATREALVSVIPS